MKPWHLRQRDGSIAFVQLHELTLWKKLILYSRGWRHTHWTWWSKRSAKRKARDDAHNAYFGYSTSWFTWS
jgi:hypothetical protein